MTEAEKKQIEDEKKGQVENLKYLNCALEIITKANDNLEKELKNENPNIQSSQG